MEVIRDNPKRKLAQFSIKMNESEARRLNQEFLSLNLSKAALLEQLVRDLILEAPEEWFYE